MNLTRKTNEIKLAEIITSGSIEDSPHLITAYTATLSEEDFELNEENDELTPKNIAFLQNVVDKCDLTNAAQIEMFEGIKNQVLDRVKMLLVNSPGSSRRSSFCSTASKKRDWDDENDETPDSVITNPD